jgi:MFS family permease
MVFVMLDIASIVWSTMAKELGYTQDQLLASYGCTTAGLAVGCILFIPFGLKYGRRPLYLFSIATSFAAVIWQAKQQKLTDLYVSSLLMGLAGAIAEALCLMTVADIFFTHQRATVNGIYATVSSVGAFLGPVAAGYAADSQGWRW